MGKSMDRQLARLVELAEAGADDDVRRAMLAWSPSELVAAQWAARNGYHGISTIDGVGMGTAWLLGLSRDGRCREAAVVRMSADASPLTDRILALLLSDHVRQVRERAERVARSRLDRARASASLPVLIALRDRVLGAEALRRYCEAIGSELGVEPWTLAWLSDDGQTRRWAVRSWLDGRRPLGEVLQRLDTEPDPSVAAIYVGHIIWQAKAADAEPLVASANARVRAAGVWLTADPVGAGIDALLCDRSRLVRAAAQHRLTSAGMDVEAWYRGWWDSSQSPRALTGMVEVGAELDRDVLLGLISEREPGTSATAVRALESRRLDHDTFTQLAGLLRDPMLGPTAVATLRRSGGWSYDDLAPAWARADAATRGRLARALASRDGWDRVRAGLLAASDPDLGHLGVDLVGQAAVLLSPYVREPYPDDPERRADLERLLGEADLDLRLRRLVEERAGLELTPEPSRLDGWSSAHAALLLALAGTGRLLRPSLPLAAVRRSAAFAIGIQLGTDELDAAIRRLITAGLVVPPRGDDLALTSEGRSLVRGLHAHAPGAVEAALERLETRA